MMNQRVFSIVLITIFLSGCGHKEEPKAPSLNSSGEFPDLIAPDDPFRLIQIDNEVIDTINKMLSNEIYRTGITSNFSVGSLSFYCRLNTEEYEGVISFKQNRDGFEHYSFCALSPSGRVPVPHTDIDSFDGDAQILVAFIYHALLMDKKEVTDVQQINVVWHGARWKGDFLTGYIELDNQGDVVTNIFGRL